MRPGRITQNAGLLANKGFLAGIMFAGAGCLALFVGRNLVVGTAVNMGPGYVPRLLALALISLGALISVRAIFLGSDHMEKPRWRPLGMITLGVVAFALLIERAGLIPAGVVLIVLASLGGHEFRPLEVAILCVVVLALCAVVFKFGLDMPFSLVRGIW